MGLFKVFTDVVTMPVRFVVDVAQVPMKLIDGEDLLENTSKGLKKIEKDLED